MTEQEKQPVETEEVNVGDTPVIIERQADDTLTVRVPKGISDEAKEELRKSIEEGNVSKLVAAWNRKNQQMNEEMTKLEQLKAELAKPPKAPEPKQETSTQEPLWKKLGLESEAELDEWAADNPAAYARAVAKAEAAQNRVDMERALDSRLAKLNEEASRQQLLNTIAAQGYDPLDIQAFARMNAIADLGKAFSLYQQLHRDKSDPVLAAMKEAGKKQINYIEQSHYRHKANPTPDEIAQMSDEELEEWSKYATERAAREG